MSLFQNLLEYSRRENLPVEFDFEPKRIHWLIQLDKNGKMSGPSIPNIEEVINNNNGKKQVVVKTLNVPYSDPNYISIPVDPEYYFLFGQSKVLLSDDDKQSSRDKLTFVKNILFKFQHNAQMKSIWKFLNNTKECEKVLKDLKQQKMKPTDWLTFYVDGNLCVNSKDIKSLWRKHRKESSRTNKNNRRCYLTGENKPCVDKPTKIASLPKLGAVDLTGFGNKDSFIHYGLDAVTIGIEEDNLLRQGLYRLCEQGTFQGDVVYISWTKEKIEDPIGLDLLLSDDEDAIKKLMESPVTGKEFDFVDTNQYYLYGLTVSSGRLVIVEEHQMSLSQVQRNIQSWFGRMGNRKYSIRQLTGALTKFNDGKGMKAHIWKNYFRQLLNSAILNRPISSEIWSRALSLELVDRLTEQPPNDSRLAVLRLCSGGTNNNDRFTKLGKLIGGYENLHCLALTCSGNHGGRNHVNSMMNTILNRPRYAYEILKKRFGELEQSYTDKIDKKFPRRGTQLYRELNANPDFEIPERLLSNTEKTNFLLSFVETTRINK